MSKCGISNQTDVSGWFHIQITNILSAVLGLIAGFELQVSVMSAVEAGVWQQSVWQQLSTELQ